MANLYIRFPSTTFSGSIGTVTAVQPDGTQLHTTVDACALPTGAATSANQSTEIGLLTTIDADTGLLSGCVSSNKIQTDVNSVLGTLDLLNSTTTPLSASATFTGTWVQNTNFGSIQVGVKSDVASATNGFQMQFSHDGINVDHVHYYTYAGGGVGIGYLFQPEFKYYRVVFVNDGFAQANFVLSTTTRPYALFPSQYRVSTNVTNETQAIMTRAVITGETTAGGGGFVNVKVNPSGALVADVTGTVAATQNGTWNINNVSGTVSLPTGAATETTLSSLNGKVTACDTGAVTVASSALPTGAATESTLSSLNGKVTACNTGNVTVSSSALPTGAATSAKQPALGTAGSASSDVITVQGIASMTALKVDGSAVTQPVSGSVKPQGLSNSNAPVYNIYSSSPVTTASYVQLVASLSNEVQWIDIFDSSGQGMILATGAAGAENIVAYIPPGGISLNLAIAQSTRVAIKALTGNATSGYLLMNFRG